MSDNQELLRNIVEGAILAAGEPLSMNRILSLFEGEEPPEKAEILTAIEAIQEHCEGRGYRLVEVASGWRFQVNENVATWVNRLWDEKPQKYSRALLETLAIIAYRQPLTRSDIEDVRGVAVSSHIIKTLTERDWIKVVGHRDVPGRPSLFATTRQFLDYFNLKSLDELPTLGELKDIESLNESLAFDDGTESSEGDEPISEENTEQTSSPDSPTEASDAHDEESGEPLPEESNENELSAVVPEAEPETEKSELNSEPKAEPVDVQQNNAASTMQYYESTSEHDVDDVKESEQQRGLSDEEQDFFSLNKDTDTAEPEQPDDATHENSVAEEEK